MRLGVMCSGNGSNFENIVRTCKDDEVVLMIHNKKECGAAKRAGKLGIPHCNLKSGDEEEIIKLFQAWRVDLIVLAGWMKVVSSKLIEAFPRRIINIHPSLLPKYKGLNAVQQALDARDLITGCTVHIVEEEVDSGEILIQSAVPICTGDTEEILRKKIQYQEHKIISQGIAIAAQKLR